MVKFIADLHMHGPIGFQNYWLDKQGYKRGELLGSILNVCFSKCYEENADSVICALTSEEDKIPRDSIHNRLGYLIKHQLKSLPPSYHVSTLGGRNNVIVAEKSEGNKKVFLVNSQTVRVQENGKKLQHLIVGSNQVRNLMSLEDTLKYCKENKLIQIAEHLSCRQHFGIGKKLFERYIEYFDAIEGHNSQIISRTQNKRAKKLAKKYKKPCVATSDAHRIEDALLSYISFNSEIGNSSEERFFQDITNVIKEGNFTCVERYEKISDWLKWAPLLLYGLKFDSGKITDNQEISK